MNENSAITIAGFAGFQLIDMWNKNAPSLAELRAVSPNEAAIEAKLHDAEILVGGTAIILGSTVYVLTHNAAPLILMVTMFLSVAGWSRYILRCNPVGKDRERMLTEEMS